MLGGDEQDTVVVAEDHLLAADLMRPEPRYEQRLGLLLVESQRTGRVAAVAVVTVAVALSPRVDAR
jgi:hypothetical protein